MLSTSSKRRTAKQPRAARASTKGDTRAAFLFLSPWIIGFLVFTLWPVGYSAYLSLTDYDVLNNPNFVGLDNYRQMLSDPKVSLALGNTIFYTVFSVPIHIIAALALALLLNRAGRAAGFFRTAFYLPNMTPPVAVGVMVLLLLNGQNGLVNSVLGWFGIQGPDWTTDPNWVKPGLILMSLLTLGGSIIIFLAALRAVPEELEESAKLDGANAWQRTLRIKLPMISGTIFFLTIVNTIAAFQSFTEAYTAFFGSGSSTYGNDAALFYGIYLFQQAFTFLHMGYASALAWLLFVVVLLVTLIQVRLSRRFVYYESAQP
ncbi:sugar ABC transporter permease [Paenarthrobacter sp. Z7-10]|uniref:carbohydrate ABC transporter permease n=1 Tax=Paenarthrobacter sp. Z7-10 TaxID=2787635 RepID=UPI0022A8E616|nr:sugar ABC transporter permease [Paenarthrobacter sp. Z7-10]MCZ2404366.1 sugar ABC transporter permease [Paenarthrobacter sp. Z7-10]